MIYRWVGALVGLALFGVAGAAKATLIEMSFTATGFSSSETPQDPVSGSITWNAASTTATIDSLVSVSLTIAGHPYSLAEIGDIDLGLGESLIGGTTSAVGGILTAGGADDFWIIWSRVALTPVQFAYATTTTEFTSTLNFTSFVIGEVVPQVPEPSTLAIFAFGLFGLGFVTRRRRTGVGKTRYIS